MIYAGLAIGMFIGLLAYCLCRDGAAREFTYWETTKLEAKK